MAQVLPLGSSLSVGPSWPGPVNPTPDGRAFYDDCLSPHLARREQAYQALGRRLQAMLWPRVARDARLEHLAADCAQEALFKIHQQLSAGRGPEDPDRFLAWAARIAANCLLDQLRLLEPGTAVGRARRVALSRQQSLDAAAEDDGRSLADRLADEAVAPPPQVAEARALLELLGRIRSIPAVSERSRTVLLRGYLEEWDDEELAQALGTSRGNVHVIRCRDLEKLRRDPAFMAELRRWREALP